MARYTPKIPDWPKDERPRERLIKHGVQNLSDTEILAILLRVGNYETTAIDLARKIINDFGGFRGLDRRSVSELCQINGIGPAKAAQIKAAIEVGKRLFMEDTRTRDRVECSEDVYKLVSPHLRDLDREVIRLLLLTSRNGVIADKIIFEGSLTESVADPREIIKEALNQGAASLVIVHNHPSGVAEPSEQDRLATKRLKNACEAVSIRLMDHLIVGQSGYFSFADSGLL